MTHNQVLQAALDAWNSCAGLRAKRQRHKSYTYGDQWGDIIVDTDGGISSERDFYAMRNHNPSTDNIIRQLVKTVVGCYRTVHSGAGTDVRAFEEFLISGCALQRLSVENRGGGIAKWVDNVSPGRFFVNAMMSPSGDDAEVLGQLHDMTFSRLMLRFSHGEKERITALRRLYPECSDSLAGRSLRVGESNAGNLSFRTAPSSMCRVIEVWTLALVPVLRCHDTASGKVFRLPAASEKDVAAENAHRREASLSPVEFRHELARNWECRFLTPDGELLHSSTASVHPYVFKFYPFIDGEIHSFVEDLIEQQRNINRLLTLNDRILATAAKGVLLFPDEQMSRHMSMDEVADNFSIPDGIVRYYGKAGVPPPQQLVTTMGNLGIDRMIERQLRFAAEASGVSNALRGIDIAPGMSASMYQAGIDNSLSALADIFDTFKEFIAERDSRLNAFPL